VGSLRSPTPLTDSLSLVHSFAGRHEGIHQAQRAIYRTSSSLLGIPPLPCSHPLRPQVNIALIEGSTPILGVVQVPATGKVYYAAKGQGAFMKNTPDGPAERISVKTFSTADEGLTLVGSASHNSAATTEFVSQFTSPQFKQLGSSLKLLMVAEGLAHCYPRLAPTCEWDTCAAHAIVLEAGGEVIQAGLCDNKGVALEDWKEMVAKELPVVYNKENVLNPYFVVYGKRTSS